MMNNLIAVLIIALLVFLAVRKILQNRKMSDGCISCMGCPLAGKCSEDDRPPSTK